MAHDVTKLPRWAQHMIQNLERDNEALRDRLDDVTGTSPEEADELSVVADPHGPHPMSLHHRRGAMEYQIGTRTTLAIRRDNESDRVFEIRGTGPLRITPAVTNVIHVEALDHFDGRSRAKEGR